MIEEASSIFWGLSVAFNIILLLIGLPLCLLICCCCRKHQGTLEKDLKSLAVNHKLIKEKDSSEEEEEEEKPKKKKKRVKEQKVNTLEMPNIEDELIEEKINEHINEEEENEN